MPHPTLLSIGGNKLAMIWHTDCRQIIGDQSLYWSIFEMTKEEPTDDDGLHRLAAHPLSQVCYHLCSGGEHVQSYVPIFFHRSKEMQDLAKTMITFLTNGVSFDKDVPLDKSLEILNVPDGIIDFICKCDALTPRSNHQLQWLLDFSGFWDTDTLVA